MIVLYTSAGREQYVQFVLQVLSYPESYVLADVPFGLDRVGGKYAESVDQLAGLPAVIVLVGYDATAEGAPAPRFYPLRQVTIDSSRCVAGKLLLDLELQQFPLYDDAVRQSYVAPGPATPRAWCKVLAEADDSPRAIPTGSAPMRFAHKTSWKSGGKFIIELSPRSLDLDVDPAIEASVRRQRNDWKSVIDMIGSTTLLSNRLFYQTSLLGDRLEQTPKKPARYGTQFVYQLRSEEIAELVVHVYLGPAGDTLTADKKVLEVAADDAYIATIGRSSIDVYPQQREGKIETLQLVTKRQTAEQFTRLTLRQSDGGPLPVLTTTEFYLRIVPRGGLLALTVGLFVLGTLLNGLDFNIPIKSGGSLPLKVLGSLVMAAAFYLGFARLPKAD
ncbi:MAG: hypothetical protein JOZ24_04005 [Candidatus Eremiobacteraeota bacterium]|nr:hypothetical protein [Candidatus Eremiobacteraeota bacterium]